jgi:hypothetical protein
VSPLELYSRERIWWEPQGWIVLNADNDAPIALKSQNLIYRCNNIKRLWRNCSCFFFQWKPVTFFKHAKERKVNVQLFSIIMMVLGYLTLITNIIIMSTRYYPRAACVQWKGRNLETMKCYL